LDPNAVTQQILDAAQLAVRKAMGMDGNTDDVQKASSLALGNADYGYSLEAPAKQLVAMMTYWQQWIPREAVATGNSHEYKRITQVYQVGKSTAAAGTRSAAAGKFVFDNPTVSFGIVSPGIWDIDYEAERAAGSFDNALARLTTNMLMVGRRAESAHLFGGNVSALAALSTVAATDYGATPVSDFTNDCYGWLVKPLTAMAAQKALAGGMVLVPDANGCVQGKAGATMDFTDGFAATSNISEVTPTATHPVKLVFTPNPKAVAYAVFAVKHATAVAETMCLFQGVVWQSQTIWTHINTDGAASVAGDTSADANDFTGLIGLLNASGSGAYIHRVGAALSAAEGNGIPEIDAMLTNCYLGALGMDSGRLVCGINDRAHITKKLGEGSATSLLRLGLPVSANNEWTGGGYVKNYVHPVTGRIVPLDTEPWVPGGMIFWIPDTVPYPMADVPAPLKFWMSYDWVNFAYAVTNPKREFETRLRGGLACYIPPAFGQLYDIWSGY
jgi:hypothetical protein